ncbi:DUF397 domain-containing protein [Micromonospora sp. LZ34]
MAGVRDSKGRGGPVLAFGPTAWTGFLAAAITGALGPRRPVVPTPDVRRRAAPGRGGPTPRRVSR